MNARENSTRTVLVAGECMLALLAQPNRPLELSDSLEVTVAGAETNVAIGLSRLGHRSRWLGRVGDDAVGRALLRRLRAEAVDVDSVRFDPQAATGLLLRDVHPDRETQVSYYRTASAASRWSRSDFGDSALDECDWVHVSGITPMLSESARDATLALIEAGLRRGLPVSIDVNIRSTLAEPIRWRETLSDLLPLSSTVFAGSDELAVLGMSAASLIRAGVEVVVTKHDDFSVVADMKGRRVIQEPYRVIARDAVGAGDAFAAGYISAALEGEPMDVRLRFGAAVAAMSVQVVGDTEGVPGRDELGRFIATGSRGGAVLR